MFAGDDKDAKRDDDLLGAGQEAQDSDGVPTLVELCKRCLVASLRDYERKPLHLPDVALEEVLKIAGSQVSPELLRKIDEDRDGDATVRDMLEPFWEQVCKRKFRTSWETALERHKTWRRRYRHLEKQLNKRMKATERLAEKRKREDEKSRKAKRVKPMSMNSGLRVPTNRQLQDGFMNPGVSRPRSTRGASRAIRTSRPPEDRMAKVMRLAGKSANLTRAKPNR
ncbi:Hypothetical Protein FCC1311_000772 [Hondaea fermentalgiana]|uniref:Uncharacterized protein n=1 Tax=Hondaea fermentalgiana TaxID=2315210 RepID=A0A2R5FYM5_9STRA|nr:Hypothetical Protein FCC1311_000772 [Hondaea fermentalgiana]|eukprot:GBG23857.1 Hypothetical Protein FCC1311_000772 [Hondaea fermentalgiana]